VKRRDQGDEKHTAETNEKEKEVRGGSMRESRTAEVYSTVKSRMWDVYLQNLRGGAVWRTAKFTNAKVGATVEALTDGEGKQSYMIAEK